MKKMMNRWPLNMAYPIADKHSDGGMWKLDPSMNDEEVKPLINDYILGNITELCTTMIDRYADDKDHASYHGNAILLIEYYQNGTSMNKIRDKYGITTYRFRKIRDEFIDYCVRWTEGANRMFMLLNNAVFPYNVIAMLNPKYTVVTNHTELMNVIIYIVNDVIDDDNLRHFFWKLFFEHDYKGAQQFAFDCAHSGYGEKYELVVRKSELEIKREIDRQFRIRCNQLDKLFNDNHEILSLGTYKHLRLVEQRYAELQFKYDKLKRAVSSANKLLNAGLVEDCQDENSEN